MTTIRILIQKTTMQGNLELFAPGVKPGAEVLFSSEANFEVQFPGTSPFDSSESCFPISSGQPVSMTVSENAVPGVYLFCIGKPEQKPSAYLQLAVETDGIDKVGFYVTDLGDVRSQMWAPQGPLTLSLEKSVVNEEARIEMSGGTIVTIESGTTIKTIPFPSFQESLSVHSERAALGTQSGGTEAADIIPVPSGA